MNLITRPKYDFQKTSINKAGFFEGTGKVITQGAVEGMSNFGYSIAWLNKEFQPTEQNQAIYDKVVKDRKLMYDEISNYERDNDYGAIKSLLVGVGRGFVGGFTNPIEFGINMAGGFLGKGLVKTGLSLGASEFLGGAVLDGAYGAFTSEGMLNDNYGAVDFAQDTLTGMAVAGALHGGLKALGKGASKGVDIINNHNNKNALQSELGIKPTEEMAQLAENQRKLQEVDDVVNLAESIGKPVTSEDYAKIVTKEYDTSKLDAIQNVLRSDALIDKTNEYYKLSKDVRSENKAINLDTPTLDRLNKLGAEIEQTAKPTLKGNDKATKYLNEILPKYDIQVSSKDELSENLREVSRLMEKLNNSTDEAESAKIIKILENHQREVRLLNNEPSFKDFHTKFDKIKATEVTSFKEENKIPLKYKTVTKNGEKVQVRRYDADFKAKKWKAEIRKDLNLPEGIKVVDIRGYIPKTKVDTSVIEGGEGNFAQVKKRGAKYIHEPPVGDMEFTYKGDRYYFSGQVDPNTKKWVGDIQRISGEKEIKKLQKIGDPVPDTPEVKAKKAEYKKILEENGIDDEKIFNNTKKLYELQDEIDEALELMLGKGYDMNTYHHEIEAYKKAKVNVNDKALYDIINKENTLNDYGYKTSQAEVEDLAKYSDEALSTDEDYKELTKTFGSLFEEVETGEGKKESKSNLAKYVMCIIGG